MRRDFLTPTILIIGIVFVVLFFWITFTNAQTTKTAINNGILQSDLNAAGFKILSANMADYAGLNMTWNPVTGRFDGASGGAGAVSSVFTRTGAVVALVGDYSAFYQPLDADLTTWAGLTPSANFQTMVPHTFAQMKTDLSLVIGTNVQAWDTDLDAWALKTPYAGTVTVTTGKTFNCTGNLTLAGTDGSTLNMGGGGTLGTAAYTASTAYQTADSDLTTWAGITPVAAVGTWIATPSSANLRLAMTDENGTGALLFSGATTPDFTTGFTIGGAAATGKILIGNGTNYVVSTPTYPTAAGAVGYTIRSDATNLASYPAQLVNSSTASQSPSTSDVYLAGSSIVLTAGDFKQKGQYRCTFDMAKTAGTGAIVITLRIGTAGTTSDAAIQTFTYGAGTSVSDTGIFEVIVNWRSVGSGSSAVVQGISRGTHNLATTGLFNNAAGWVVIGSPSPSSGFNSSTATTIGLSFNGSTAFAGTTTMLQAALQQ